MLDEVRAGHLDSDATAAVLAAVGHRAPKRREWPAGLTSREVEILRLVARGQFNKQIAANLTISPKTAGTHIEHIYTKLGVTNRALASLSASRLGLISTDAGTLVRKRSGKHPIPLRNEFRTVRNMNSTVIAIIDSTPDSVYSRVTDLDQLSYWK